MYIKRFIYSKFGRYVMSMLLGFGLASLFRRACKERNCLKFVGAPIDKIDKQIFEYNNICYTFEDKAESCSPLKKIVSFA